MAEGIRTDITKEEAARRQIETAITLFFFDGDEVSVHVLAHSAAVILADVCEKKGITEFRATAADYVKPEYLAEFGRKLKEAYNYFKHADKDAFEELERFNPASNEFLLFVTTTRWPRVALAFNPSRIFHVVHRGEPALDEEGFPAQRSAPGYVVVLPIQNAGRAKAHRKTVVAGLSLEPRRTTAYSGPSAVTRISVSRPP